MNRNKGFAIRIAGALLCLAVLASCGGKYGKTAERSASQPEIFPDYTDVAVPTNIAPMNFEMRGASHLRATIEIDGHEEECIDGDDKIVFPEKTWKRLLGAARGKAMSITLAAWSKEKPGGVEYRPFRISVSPDSIDPWIAYRLIPPGYELWNRMGIYERELSTFREKTIIENAQNNRGCVNCHSFCNYNPRTWLFHARGEGGSTMLTIDGRTRKLPIEKMGPRKSATYPSWHPSGGYVAFSSNKTRQTFYGISRNKIEVFDLSSDLIIYDVKHDSVLTDARFCNTDDWETFPSFSPDGRWLYLCTAHLPIPPQERGKLQAHFEQMKYALIRIPFDARTGKLGAEVDTIYSPARSGGSASFPRVSPDGRYMMFTEAACATFPIQHAEADLKMIDLATGKSVDTRVLNSPTSDSYHSWSSSGRWLVFSSKRIDGKYTRLFFSHFDGRGHFSKPFMLPQRDPEHNGERLYAYNIPEFINGEVHLDREKTAEMFRTK